MARAITFDLPETLRSSFFFFYHGLAETWVHVVQAFTPGDCPLCKQGAIPLSQQQQQDGHHWGWVREDLGGDGLIVGSMVVWRRTCFPGQQPFINRCRDPQSSTRTCHRCAISSEWSKKLIHFGLCSTGSGEDEGGSLWSNLPISLLFCQYQDTNRLATGSRPVAFLSQQQERICISKTA